MGSNPIEGTTSSLHPWHHGHLSLDVGGVLDVDVNLVPPKKPRFHGRIELDEVLLDFYSDERYAPKVGE